MRWIGLTGGIASGKSTVSQIIRTKGYAVIDADHLAREVVAAGTAGHAEVVSIFGPGSVSPGGEIDRKKIADIVFSERSKLIQLEAILHPRIRQLAEKKRLELAAAGHEVAFYDVPLLFEKNMRSLFDRVVVVACGPALELARLMARDKLDRASAEARIAAQMPLVEKTHLADDVILNDGSLAELEEAVVAYLSRLA